MRVALISLPQSPKDRIDIPLDLLHDFGLRVTVGLCLWEGYNQFMCAGRLWCNGTSYIAGHAPLGII